MINIKTKESQLELDIGFYDHYFHADDLSCIDQPIAVCADLFFKSAYFFYSLYIIWSENWYYPLKTEFLESRQQILSKIGLKIDFKMLKESENFLFLKTIKRYIDLRKPVILYLHRASIIYDQVYGDIAYDSIHGIMVTGYNMDHPTICLRDAAHIENSGAKYEGSGYGLFRIWLKEELLKNMWMDSYNLYPEDEFTGKIVTINKIDNSLCNINLKSGFQDIIENGSIRRDKFLEWMKNNEDAIYLLGEDDVSRQIRRNYILPREAFFKILNKCCNEIGKYDEECKKIENDYIISLETVFNRLCINAKKGKINEKGTLKTYIEKIEQMNYQLEQFIKKVVYSF